jgi:hypothetical protein
MHRMNFQTASATANRNTGNDWFDRPMRWAQLTLAENDPVQYDVNFWLDFFRRAKCDAACLSAAGCVAYYPSKIPFHYVTPFMKEGQDCFGELYEGCRKLGMVVIARTDPHAVHQDACEAHPEWIARNPDGSLRKHWADPDLWVTCALGPYNFEYMNEINKEIMSMYPVDGIFSNRWAGHGICYCESCQRNFYDATGYDLPGVDNVQTPGGHTMPRVNDTNSQAYRAYVSWSQERLFDLWEVWDRDIRALNPKARYIPNAGGGALSHLNMDRVGQMADTLFADRQARRGLDSVWSNGKNGKEYRATLGHKPIGGIFSMGVEEPYRWKDSVQNSAEIEMWVADGVANGLRPWFTKFCGMIYDPRWLNTVEQLYNRYARWEPYLRNVDPIADVAIVYSQRTAHYYGGQQAHKKVEDHIRGFYQAMIEARIPFEMVHEDRLATPETKKYKTLILPNTAALSDEQCEEIRQYVRGGGNIIATYETSLYDEWGNRREDFGLADLFGVCYAGGIEGPMQNSYLNIERDADGQYHPILMGVEDAGRIINGVNRVKVEPTSPLNSSPLTLVPSYPDLPMEMVWVRVPHTDIPGVFIRSYGEGSVIYFPWDVDRTFWEVLCTDHGALLRNAVDYTTGSRPITVSGPGVLDVTVWTQKDSMTVHLVNLTNPMMMKGPIRELMAVGEQAVRVRLPEGRKVTRVQLLNAGVTPIYTLEDGWLSTRVPSVLDHEVIAVDLA